MIFKRILIVCSILFIGSEIVFSQYNPDSRKHLDDALEKLQSNKGTKMEYSLFQIDFSGEEELSAGVVFMQNDNYKVVSEEFVVISNGVDQWIYRPEDKELMIQTPDSLEADESNPVNLLSSYKNGYKFDVQLENDKEILVNLIPEDSFSPYLLVTVRLNKVEKEFVSLKMTMKDESALRIDMKYVDKEISLDEDFFNFDKLGFEVLETIDLRE